MRRRFAFALSLALVACSSSSSDGSSGTDGGSNDPFAAARAACVGKINEYRATLGLAPYAEWSSADACADDQAKSDSSTGAAHGAFGECGESAQNECPGWPAPPETSIQNCLAMMWGEGPGDFAHHGHYVNMSSTSYSTVACGFHVSADGSFWAVQDFR